MGASGAKKKNMEMRVVRTYPRPGEAIPAGYASMPVGMPPPPPPVALPVRGQQLYQQALGAPSAPPAPPGAPPAASYVSAAGIEGDARFICQTQTGADVVLAINSEGISVLLTDGTAIATHPYNSPSIFCR